MARVFSQLLGLQQGFSSAVATPLFVADNIHRTVAKCITIAVGVNIIPGEARVLHTDGSLLAVVSAQVSDLPTKASVGLSYGEWVFEPGDTCYIQTEGGWTADFHVSGYLLALP